MLLCSTSASCKASFCHLAVSSQRKTYNTRHPNSHDIVVPCREVLFKDVATHSPQGRSLVFLPFASLLHLSPASSSSLRSARRSTAQASNAWSGLLGVAWCSGGASEQTSYLYARIIDYRDYIADMHHLVTKHLHS